MAGDPRAAAWNWDEEEHGIRAMCFTFVSKNPDLAYTLPDNLRETFEERRDADADPGIFFRRGAGWHVRSRKPGSSPNYERNRAYRDRHAGGDAAAGGDHADGGRSDRADHQDAPKAGKTLTLRPFVLMDEALLPTRSWLYGKHYQRGHGIHDGRPRWHGQVEPGHG